MFKRRGLLCGALQELDILVWEADRVQDTTRRQPEQTLVSKAFDPVGEMHRIGVFIPLAAANLEE